MRLAPRRAAIAVSVSVLLLGSAGLAGAQPDPRSELDRITEELERAREELADIESRQDLTLADLEASEGRRADIEAELARAEEQLAAAEEELARAEETLATTTESLRLTRQRLADTRIRLEQTRDEFRARARASYMYGGTADAPAAMLEVEDVAEFSRALGYVQSVLNGDRRVVELVQELEAQVDREVEALDALQEQQDAQRAEAQGRRDDVAALVEQQRLLKQEADAEVDRHQQIVAQLEADAEAGQELIDSLDAESEALEGELRRRQEAAEREAAARAAAANDNDDGDGDGDGDGESSSDDPPPASSGQFQMPCDCPIGSGFGYRVHPISGVSKMHTGLDMRAPTGEPIYAADSGTVVSAGPRGGYGNATVIDHGGGLATLYAHQSRLAASAGDQVGRGEVIGYVGSTGYSTGPHLHFEVRINGTPVDPLPYLEG